MAGEPTTIPAAPDGTLPQHLQKLLAKVTAISTLPEVTARIVQVVEDPHASAREVHDVVRTDPSLAARIIKVVNSAFYGLPQQIAGLDRAILLLGITAVKNIALAASLSKLFDAGDVTGHTVTRALWRHCVAVGVCARLLVQTARPGQADEAFVAGLVHDMGLLVEQQLFPTKLKQVLNQCVSTADLCPLERKSMGADHQAFGHALASAWGFPAGLRVIIGYHHESTGVDEAMRAFVHTVHLADQLCYQNGWSLSGRAVQQAVSDDLLDAVGVTRAQMNDVVAALPAQVAEAEQVFGKQQDGRAG